MSAFTLDIETVNDAFGPTASDRATEIARILRDLAARLEGDASVARAPDVDEYALRDRNGNRCGLASMRPRWLEEDAPMIRPSLLAGAIALGLAAPTLAADAPPFEIHYAPTENLEHIDIRLIDGAKHRIDATIYVLSDWAIIDALKRAVGRGVEVRIVLDRMQKHAYDKFDELEPWMRFKVGNAPMHLKSFEVDGEILRTGSANFSASGLKQQDNDLVIVRSPDAAKAFEREFERIWKTGEPVKVEARR